MEQERFADDPEYREWIMGHLIRSADVEIVDVETRRYFRQYLTKSGSEAKPPERRVAVSFVHEGISKQPIGFSTSSERRSSSIWRGLVALANEPVTIFADG